MPRHRFPQATALASGAMPHDDGSFEGPEPPRVLAIVVASLIGLGTIALVFAAINWLT